MGIDEREKQKQGHGPDRDSVIDRTVDGHGNLPRSQGSGSATVVDERQELPDGPVSKGSNGGTNSLKSNDHDIWQPAEPSQQESLPNLASEAEKGQPSPASSIEGDTGRRTHQPYTLGRFRFRAEEDDDPQDWWFASTAIPLIAATAGPLANVLSVAALVSTWRSNLTEPDTVASFEATSVGFSDPHWCIALNIASLVCGFIGNLFLLFNFTKFVRYIVALPMTIILWYFATGLLMGITISMNKYVPPGPNQIYSQGFWHAVIAACLYMFCSMLLMANMLGYFLGHYPQHFTLTDDQRNLILQSVMFFLWLAGGAGVFVRTNYMSFADALYFCDVTILTVGFGDFHPVNDVSRGLVFPYSVGGIIILGLLVSSIHRFVKELSQDKVIRTHMDRKRHQTLTHAVTSSSELERTDLSNGRLDLRPGHRPHISSPIKVQQMYNSSGRLTSDSENANGQTTRRAVTFDDDGPSKDFTPGESSREQNIRHRSRKTPLYNTMRAVTFPVRKLVMPQDARSKITIMKDERDRFEAMRKIQRDASRFKRWFSLTLSVTAFATLWCIGAIGFWKAEKRTQHLSYFEALYFCYVSLLTIGYGDLSPQSNAGKPLFIVWSLLAVPTMTILVSDMGDTVIDSFKRGTFTLADWTILPKQGIYKAFAERNPWLFNWVQSRVEKKKLKAGFEVGPDDRGARPTIEELAQIESCSEAELTRQLAFAIRRTADDLKNNNNQKYSYEEWVEFTRLIRFTQVGMEGLEYDEEENGVVDWDWVGDDSPMLSDQSETEWVLDRLCESLLRLLRRDILKVRPEVEAQDKKLLAEELSAHGEAPASSEGSDDDDIRQEPLWRSIDDVLEAPEQRERPARRHSTGAHGRVDGVEPTHRVIGLFPEMEPRVHDNPPSSAGLRYVPRRPSGLSGSSRRSERSDAPSRENRRKSNVAPSAVTRATARSPTRRKGPFKYLTIGGGSPTRTGS